MLEEYRFGIDADQAGLFDEFCGCGCGKPLTEQEIAIAVHEINGCSLLAEAGQRRCYRVMLGPGVIADPGFKKVTEDE